MVGGAALNRARCRRSIRGPSHAIVTQNSMLRNVRFRPRGSGHRIVIGPQARLSNLLITMEGTGHELLIGSDVRAHAGAMSFYDDRCTISIDEHVWLGVRVMVPKGGRIAANSMVGAGSIVTGVAPEGCIAAGMPARVLAQGVTWRGERD
jgi:acetyltransferase-like isoleucine patch superfamily enzyme